MLHTCPSFHYLGEWLTMEMMMVMMIVTAYLSVSAELCEGAGEEELIYAEDANQGGGQKQNIKGGTKTQNNKGLFLNLRGAI